MFPSKKTAAKKHNIWFTVQLFDSQRSSLSVLPIKCFYFDYLRVLTTLESLLNIFNHNFYCFILLHLLSWVFFSNQVPVIPWMPNAAPSTITETFYNLILLTDPRLLPHFSLIIPLNHHIFHSLAETSTPAEMKRQNLPKFNQILKDRFRFCDVMSFLK